MKAAKKLYAAYLRQYPLETPWSELDRHEKQDWVEIAKEFLEANAKSPDAGEKGKAND